MLDQWAYGWDGKQANYHHKRVWRVRSHRGNRGAVTKGTSQGQIMDAGKPECHTDHTGVIA